MDLTTLARLRAYLAGVSQAAAASADTVYSAMISRASDQCVQWTGRSFQRTTFSSVRLNGSGTDRLRLPADPVISLSALAVDGYVYLMSSDALAVGYQYDTRFVYLFGGPFFRKANRNVVVSFIAGYSTSQSAFIPAAPGPYSITPVTGSGVGPDGRPAGTGGPASVDQGVVYVATGAALTKVGSSPSTGEYAFSDGVYTFAAADAGLEVTMSYDFVPGAIEQGVLELIGTWFVRRMNLGVQSMAIGQETTVYADKDLPAAVKALWQPYRYVIAP